MDEPNTGRELVSGKAMVDRPRLHINKLNWVSLWKPFPTGGVGCLSNFDSSQPLCN